MKKELVMIIFVMVVFPSVTAVLNPSAVYCTEMGYEFLIENTPEGAAGICKLPDGAEVDAWDFLRGKIGQEYSHCAIEGYEIKTVTEPEGVEYAVCIKPEGEVEVIEDMGLDLREEVCGDENCIGLETSLTCPQDCEFGGEDGVCDEVHEGICDPDCREGEDSDCPDYEKPEIVCLYDGICYEECKDTDDIDCLCINPKSEECQETLNKVIGKEADIKTGFIEEKDRINENLFCIFLIVIAIVFVLIYKFFRGRRRVQVK